MEFVELFRYLEGEIISISGFVGGLVNLPEDGHTFGQFETVVDDARHSLKAIHVILELLGEVHPGTKSHWDGFVGHLGHLEEDVQGTRGLAQQVVVELQRHLGGSCFCE